MLRFQVLSHLLLHSPHFPNVRLGFRGPTCTKRISEERASGTKPSWAQKLQSHLKYPLPCLEMTLGGSWQPCFQGQTPPFPYHGTGIYIPQVYVVRRTYHLLKPTPFLCKRWTQTYFYLSRRCHMEDMHQVAKNPPKVEKRTTQKSAFLLQDVYRCSLPRQRAWWSKWKTSIFSSSCCLIHHLFFCQDIILVMINSCFPGFSLFWWEGGILRHSQQQSWL